MSNSSRDNRSPYVTTPHQHGPTRKVEFAGPMQDYVIREMGDSTDCNKTVQAENVTQAVRKYARSKWNRKAAFLLPLYVKVEGERYVRCVEPSGRVEVMGW